MKRLKLRRIEVIFKDKHSYVYKVSGSEGYIESWANRAKDKERFNISMHMGPQKHEVDRVTNYVLNMDDIEKIIQEWS